MPITLTWPCAECGAMVTDPDQHRRWHDGLVKVLAQVQLLATTTTDQKEATPCPR